MADESLLGIYCLYLLLFILLFIYFYLFIFNFFLFIFIIIIYYLFINIRSLLIGLFLDRISGLSKSTWCSVLRTWRAILELRLSFIRSSLFYGCPLASRECFFIPSATDAGVSPIYDAVQSCHESS